MKRRSAGPGRRSAKREGGFTLLEVMLTITITAVMIGILYGVLIATLQAREKIEKAAETDEAGPVVLKLLADDLAAAFVPPVPDAPPPAEGEPAAVNPSYFVGKDASGSAGDADTLDFISSRDVWDPANQRVADFAEVGYFLRPNPDDTTLSILVRREDPYVDDKPASGGTLQEMYNRVKTLKLQYFDGKDWLDKWGDVDAQKKTLPQIVKITLIIVPDAELAKKDPQGAEKTYILEVAPVH
ncbi:MAG: prepilin-type N-terminal cleavage/methylation domain-containing protein [Planctomycetes bacterium]|nr:prepilin-type N-terminal cleavage/methylation domain-containing protein [Planctomycetota bacterium]